MALPGIDPVKIADAYGVEGLRVDDDDQVADQIERALKIVEDENRPYLLDVRLPLGLPAGGKAAKQYRLVEA